MYRILVNDKFILSAEGRRVLYTVVVQLFLCTHYLRQGWHFQNHTTTVDFFISSKMFYLRTDGREGTDGYQKLPLFFFHINIY